MNRIKIIEANYNDKQHEKDIQFLLNDYACDPMGGGQALADEVKENIVKSLARLTYAFSLIAYDDDKPVGLTNCFEAFSTFACKPLINIHDFMVIKDYRGRGISQIMLKKIDAIARAKGCCKVTLEVLSKNESAKSAYKKFGFSDYELDPNAGTALFWQKNINESF